MSMPADAMAARTRLAVLPQPAHWVLYPAILAVITFALGFSVKGLPDVTRAELSVDQLFGQHHHGVLNAVALVINTVFSPAGSIVILILVFSFLLLVRKSPVNAVAACSTAVVGWLSSEIFKLLVSEPPPNQSLLTNVLVPEPGSDSFPSGHTAFAVALAIAVWFLARNTRWSVPAFVTGLVFAGAVGLSRIYLGHHYPTDTLGSLLAATAAIMFYTGIWNRYGLAVLRRVPLIERFGPIPAAPTRSATRRGNSAHSDGSDS